MPARGQPLSCQCGTRLARDNPGLLCSACQRNVTDLRAGAPLVPPDFWLFPKMREALASRHIGQIIYAYRTHPYHRKALAQEIVSGWLDLSQAQLSRIETGPPVQDLIRLTRWAHALRIPRQVLWFELVEPDVTGAGADEVSATLRRSFLALGGSTVAGHLLATADSELSMIHMTLDRGTASAERAAGLEQVAAELGVQVGKAAPLTVLEPALVSVQGVRSLLVERQPTRLQTRLVRTSAKLSTVVGEIMLNVGRFAHARAWYEAAEHAASDVGDRYLADMALGGRAYLPTYSDDPRGVIALLAPRLDANPVPSPAISWLWGLRARAHAALGEVTEFDRAIANSRDCLARSPQELIAPGIFSFRPERLEFYEADGAALLTKPQRAMDAADRALALYDVTQIQEPALVRLEKARALVQAGEVPEACRVAMQAISDPRTYHTAAVRTRAQRFDRQLRTCSAGSTRTAGEWRDTYRRLVDQRNET